jgi:hypothetical protein
MKSKKKYPLVALALIVLIVAGVLAVMFSASAADTNHDSGITGLTGPEFTFGVIVSGSVGNNPLASPSGSKVFNGFPYAISGYVMSKTNGAVHIWIVECSQVVLDLGFKPGDVVAIFATASQTKDLNSGDYISIYGFTARGYLLRSDDTILPAPFSY